VAVHYPDLEAMIDAAIMVEDKNKAARESRKRRRMNKGGPSGHRSHSLPHPELRHHHRGSPLKPLGLTTQAVSTPATAHQEEISPEVTATLSTPITAARVVDVTPVVSLDTSLRSAL
jgi:hypothetical protein